MYSRKILFIIGIMRIYFWTQFYEMEHPMTLAERFITSLDDKGRLTYDNWVYGKPNHVTSTLDKCVSMKWRTDSTYHGTTRLGEWENIHWYAQFKIVCHRSIPNSEHLDFFAKIWIFCENLDFGRKLHVNNPVNKKVYLLLKIRFSTTNTY